MPARTVHALSSVVVASLAMLASSMLAVLLMGAGASTG